MQRKRDVTPIPSVFSLLGGNDFLFLMVLNCETSTIFYPFSGHHLVATSTIFTFHPIRLAPWSYTSRLHEEHHPPAGTVLVKAQPNTVCRNENLNLCCLSSFLLWIFFVLASHVQLPSIYSIWGGRFSWFNLFQRQNKQIHIWKDYCGICVKFCLSDTSKVRYEWDFSYTFLFPWVQLSPVYMISYHGRPCWKSFGRVAL